MGGQPQRGELPPAVAEALLAFLGRQRALHPFFKTNFLMKCFTKLRVILVWGPC